MQKGKPQDSVRGRGLRTVWPTHVALCCGDALPTTSAHSSEPAIISLASSLRRLVIQIPPPFMRHGLRRSVDRHRHSSIIHLGLLSSSWHNSRREILRAKSPGPASTVKVEAPGDGGTTLTGADGPYNDGAFRAKITPPQFPTHSRYGATAPPPPFRLHWIGPS